MKKLTKRGRYWQGMIEEHAASGMSIRAFCAERGIAETGLCW